MTVARLIEMLQNEDPSRQVIVQKDSEGNHYSPLSDVETDAYIPETTWFGERKLERLTDDLRSQGYGEEDVAEGGLPALFLVPVN